MLADPQAELAWLEKYAALGFGLLKNVPTKPGMVAGLAIAWASCGHQLRPAVRRDFCAEPTNLAYTAVGLGVHSDNPYRRPSPGVQLLHCLNPGAPGGDTLLVDGFAAAEALRRKTPKPSRCSPRCR